MNEHTKKILDNFKKWYIHVGEQLSGWPALIERTPDVGDELSIAFDELMVTRHWYLTEFGFEPWLLECDAKVVTMKNWLEEHVLGVPLERLMERNWEWELQTE